MSTLKEQLEELRAEKDHLRKCEYEAESVRSENESLRLQLQQSHDDCELLNQQLDRASAECEVNRQSLVPRDVVTVETETPLMDLPVGESKIVAEKGDGDASQLMEDERDAVAEAEQYRTEAESAWSESENLKCQLQQSYDENHLLKQQLEKLSAELEMFKQSPAPCDVASLESTETKSQAVDLSVSKAMISSAADIVEAETQTIDLSMSEVKVHSAANITEVGIQTIDSVVSEAKVNRSTDIMDCSELAAETLATDGIARLLLDTLYKKLLLPR